MLDIGDCRMYDGDDIFSQLKDFSKQQYLVHEPVTMSNIELAIKDIFRIIPLNSNISTMVLPINICSDKCNYPQWVGLLITRDENNIYKAFSVDALEEYHCNTAFNSEFLKGILTKNNTNVHMNLKLKHMNYDCGPLTAIILDKFARTRSVLETISEEDIKNARQRLIELKEEYSQIKRALKSFDVSRELIREIKEINPDKCKKRDIEIIIETLKLLENPTEIKSTLQQIGDLFSRLTIDINDENIIRNKYGFSAKFRNRIPFDHFSNLKEYCDHENKFQIITQDDMKILENYLSNLKRKLMDILKNEIDFVEHKHFLDQIDSISEENQDDSSLFVVTVEKYLKLQISFNIDEVIKSSNEFDPENIDDKYLFARMLTIIGESANKLEKSLTNKEMINTKFLHSIRNKIIHYHKRTILEPLDIDLIISVIRDVRQTSINDEIEILNKRKKLLQHLKYKPQIASVKTNPTNNEDAQFNLDVLLFKAAKICTGISNYSNKEKRLEKLNVNYQSQLAELKGAVKECYPKKLHLEYERKICDHSKCNIPIPSQKKFQSEIQKLNFEKTLNKNLLDTKLRDINKECNYLIKVINDKSINCDKQRYIISHSIIVIMQYVRDLSTIDIIKIDDIKNFSDETKVSLNEHFRDLLQNQFLDDDNSIRYLYSSPHIQYCPIIALIFCNVAVSLTKLKLYEQSINYLEEATKHVADFNNIIFSNDKNNSQNELYQLSINRIFAKVLHLAKRFEDSFQVFDKINKKIQINNINSDINFKNEIIQFYKDFSILLIDQKKFNDANEICKEALKLDSNNSTIKLCLLESYCKNENFIDSNLVKDLVDNSQDDGERFNIFNKIVNCCLLCSNVGDGVKKAEIYLNEMKNIILNKGGSFYHVYYQKFVLLSLEILLIKSTMENISFYPNLDKQIKNLIDEIKLKNHPIIIRAYLTVCYVHSKNAKETGEQKHIDEAKNYYEMIISKNLPIDNRQIYVTIVTEFLKEYISYSINKSSDINVEILIEHLNFSIDLQNKFNIRNSSIIKQLIKLLDCIFEKYTNNATGNDNLKQCLLFIEKKCIFNKYLGDNPDLIFQCVKQMAFCSSRLADSLFDMKFMKEAVFYYENMLLHTNPVYEILEYSDKIERYKKQINIYKTLLENILNANVDFQVNLVDQRFIDRINEKFGSFLEIDNVTLRLINMDSIPEESLRRIMEEKEYLEKPSPF